MSISSKFPSIRPTLLLDFANVGRLDPRITFTRASTATYFNELGVLTTAASGAPRFDYDPSTLQPRGLLIEEQRTNSIRNNTMQGAVAGTPGTAPTNWSVTNTATYASSIIGTGVENGINYVDIQYVVSAGAAANNSLIYADTPAATASTAYTGSYFLKLVSGSIPQIRFLWQDGVSTVARSYFSITSSLTRYDNTYTTAVGATLARFVIGINASPAGTTFVIRIGMPQTEQGSFATSIIPTTTTALTRNADVASMTGTNFSSWYNAAAGTFLAETRQFGTNLGFAFIASDGTANNRLAQFRNGTTLSSRISVGGAATNPGDLSITAQSLIKSAMASTAGSAIAVVNGVLSSAASPVSMPTVDQLRFGADQAGGNVLNGYIQRIAYYPTRLPNATLQALTL